MNEYKSIGFDQNGIPRVFGYGETILEANTNCLLASIDYRAKGRPDITINENFQTELV
tara:strand:- start:14693 stop:14866 length:174 start_codon:yes stop_codon:yes gene_type:complete